MLRKNRDNFEYKTNNIMFSLYLYKMYIEIYY